VAAHNIADLPRLLAGTPWASLAGTAQPVSLQGYQYDDLFRLGDDAGGRFALKLRPLDQPNIADSLRCLAARFDPAGLIQDYLDAFQVDGCWLLVSQWVTGQQPITSRRDSLPLFFSRLAAFNRDNPATGHFTSMYADGHYFASLADLVEHELAGHLKALAASWPELGPDWAAPGVGSRELRAALAALTDGLACLVNEDCNTGNMFLKADGQPLFIDTEWLHTGLNLHQFDHLNLSGFDEPRWYNIGAEAVACATAYFDELRLPRALANEQLRAWECLAVLRRHSSWHWRGQKEQYQLTAQRLRQLLDRPSFI